MKPRLRVMRAIFGEPPPDARCGECVHGLAGRCRKASMIDGVDSREWPRYWRGCGAFKATVVQVEVTP
jgi:hypothetical protein